MRTKLYLSPHPDGGWLGREEGHEHFLVVGQDKKEVLDHLLNYADQNRPCDIIIQNENGDFMEERTLGTRHFPL